MLNLCHARLLQADQFAELEMTVILKDMVRSYEGDENRKVRSIHRLHYFYSHFKSTDAPIKGTDTGRDDTIPDF